MYNNTKAGLFSQAKLEKRLDCNTRPEKGNKEDWQREKKSLQQERTKQMRNKKCCSP